MKTIPALLQVLATPGPESGGTSWLDTVQSGGAIGFVIIGMSVIAVALVVMHGWQLRRAALLPSEQLTVLDEMLVRRDVAGALQYCLDPANDSYLTRILGAGLTRFQKSAFGAFEVKNAIEDAGADQTARLYRSTDALGVIAVISPLLGLLGTVQGMVGAFDNLSRTAGSNSEELASNISLALVTTLLGLFVAIPCVALHAFFRNRIDAASSEAGRELERLTIHLESSGAAPSPAPRRTASAPAPAQGEARA